MWDNKINGCNFDPGLPTKATKDLNDRAIKKGVLKWSCKGASCKTQFYRILSNDDSSDESLERSLSSRRGHTFPPLYRNSDNRNSEFGNSTHASSTSRSVRSSRDGNGIPDICELITKEWCLPSELELIVWLVGPLDDKKSPDKNIKTKNGTFRTNGAPDDDGSTNDQLQTNNKDIHKMTQQIVKITADSESWLFVQANDTQLFNYVEDAIDKHLLDTRNKPAHVIGVTCWPYDGIDMCDEVEVCKKKDDEDHYTLFYNNTDENFKRGELSPSIKHHVFLDYKKIDFQTLMTENVKTLDLKDVFQCAIVVNGDEGTLTVLRRKIENRIPVILVEGSGGIADVLINTAKDGDNPYSDIVNYDNLEVLGIGDQRNGTCIGEKLLLSIQNAYRKTMEKTFPHAGHNYMRKVHFYKLCTELNRFNVLRNDENFKWKELNLKVNPWLSRIIFEAVKQGQVDFVEFFIKANFDMESAFSQRKLHELYQTKRDYPWKLSDVASFVNKLLGGSYHMSCPKLMKEDASESDHQETYYSLEKNKTAMRDLFIWSILAKKVELSKVLWKYLDHQTAAAMFAYGVAKSLLANLKSSKSGSRSDESKLKNYMGEFTSLACKTINSSYKKDEQKTFDLLRLQMSKWGETSCVRLALDSHNKKFLSTPACQKLCTQLWWWGQEVDGQPTQGKQLRNEKLRVNGTLADPAIDNIYVVQKDTKRSKTCENINKLKHFKNVQEDFRISDKFKEIDKLGLIVFLMIYGVLLVSKLDMARFSWLEWVVWTWIVIYILEGIRLQIDYVTKRMRVKNLSSKERPDKCDKLGSLIKQICSKAVRTPNILMIIDLFSYVLFLLAWSFRCAAYYYPTMREELGGTAIVIFSIDYILFCLRIFEFFYASKFLGLLLAMIAQMFLTLCKFLIILLVFFVAFAVASESVLYPQKQLSGSGIFYLFRMSYWSMFGEHFLSDIAATKSMNECTTDPLIYNTYTEVRCPSDVSRYYVHILMGIYVMITNILLFNLVIAKFNSTINNIETQAELVWNYQSFKTTLEFSKRLLLPPPFILLSLIIFFTKSSSDIFVKKIKEKHMRRKLLRLEKMSIEEFSIKKNVQQSASRSEINGKDSRISRQSMSNISLELLVLDKENTPEDGDSLFWAIILQTDNGLTPKKLRHKICLDINENLQDYESIDGGLFEGWEEVLAKTGRWNKNLRDVVLVSMANVLQRNIVMFASDKSCPLRVIPTTEETREVKDTETYLALYYHHEKEHYDALIPSSKEPKENRQEGTDILLSERLEQLNLERSANKPVKNLFHAAAKWLIKCPVEAPDMLESLVTLYLKTHGLTENAKGERSLADDSVKIKALVDLMESNVVIISNQKSRALSLVCPNNKSKQILYRRVVFCASFTHSASVDYYPVAPSDGSQLRENVWRRGKPATGLLETRLKRMGLEKWDKSGKDMFTAIADQAPNTTIDNLKEAVVQEIASSPEMYQSRACCDKEEWTSDKDIFLSALTIGDTFVDTVARAAATVLETNILIVLNNPSCPFYLVAPLNKQTNKLLYLGKMQHGQTGIYFPLSPITSGSNTKSGHDKLRRSERSSDSSKSEDSLQRSFHKPVNGKRRMSARSSEKTLDANMLRQKVCEYIEKHAMVYHKKSGLSVKDWYKELELLSKPGCWDVSLGDLVPDALAKVLGRRVVILFEDQTREQVEFNPDDLEIQATPIYLVRQQDHFHAAVEAALDDAHSIEDKDMQSERELRIMLAERDLTLIPIKRDGNCMFEAVAIQL